MDIGFICNSPTRPTLIFQEVGVSLILAQRDFIAGHQGSLNEFEQNFDNFKRFVTEYILSDQAIFLYFIKKTAKNDRFSVLGNTFQGQKPAFKDVEVF